MGTTAIIDYGMGNLHSVAKALATVGPQEQIVVAHDPEVIRHADRIVLPGVGALKDCVAALTARGLDEVVRECVQRQPMLGICLGMQALFDFSEENGGTQGLDIIPGNVVHFKSPLVDDKGNRLKVPHMGWNEVAQVCAHPLWRGIDQNSRFYFVHGYFVAPQQREVVVGETHYGAPFAAAVAVENLFAVQFHPEKSQAAGLQLLANFLQWDGTF